MKYPICATAVSPAPARSAPHRSGSSGRGVALAFVALVTLATQTLAGCREAPAEVLEAARDALKAQDTESFLELVEPRAAAFLRRAEKVVSASGRGYKVTQSARPTAALLPQGDVADVVVQDQRAILVIKRGSATELIQMRLVRGKWRLDLLEMQGFLDQLRPKSS